MEVVFIFSLFYDAQQTSQNHKNQVISLVSRAFIYLVFVFGIKVSVLAE